MRFTMALMTLALAIAPSAAMAQHGTTVAAPPSSPPREASQYDFMIGDWELKVEVPPPSFAARIHGVPKLVGTWKVRRALDGWGIEDDLHVTDMAGNPSSFAHAMRYYDRTSRKWIISSLEVYRGRYSTATGEWRGREMISTSTSKDAEGKTYMLRTRLYDITPSGFRFQQDRSEDNGKSWKEGTLKIEAHRAGAKSD
jgi:hypothetical protein